MQVKNPSSTSAFMHENLSKPSDDSTKDSPGANNSIEIIPKLQEEILQLNRELQVSASQSEKQTTEINNLRKTVSSLEFKLQGMTCTKDWFKSELKNGSRQLIEMSLSKKKVDQKIVKMEQETRYDEKSWVSDESEKENHEPRANRMRRLASQEAFLARYRHKTSSLALASKQG